MCAVLRLFGPLLRMLPGYFKFGGVLGLPN